jgi:integrase
MAINANANVKVVQQMLGHATATQTLDTYGHLWPDRLDEVAAAMEAARNRSMAEVSGTDLTVS